MKYLIIIAIIYGVYRFTQYSKTIQGPSSKKINEEDNGDYIDYEEVD